MAASKEEWRLCADWLVRCKILADGHKATWENAEVFDLAQTLRDGVLICHLLNVLSPNSIDLKDFSQRPQLSQFLCLKNIRTFLQTCKCVFGMSEKDLFDSYDLFDVKDFGKVISTLSKLSKSPLAVKSGIPGFPPERNASRRHDDDEIYRGLELRASSVGIDEDDSIYDMLDDTEEEEIYGIYVQNRRRPSKGTLEPKSQRDYCIKELLETEKNYVDVLNMLVVHFIRPLRNIITQIDKDLIFKNIEPLQQIHTAFHSELNQACTNGPASSISDCFVKWKTKFLLYSEYCSNLPRAQEHVDEVSRRNQLVAQSIAGCEIKANEGKFRLRDLLAVPMQRVLKYHLLLKELIKQTDKHSGERPALEKGLEAMQDLSLYVNEVKRDNEIIQTISEIQNSITDLQMPENTSLKDYGRLLKDGELKVKSHEDNRLKTRYIFLFDKVMLMCKSKGESYSYKFALILSQYKVDEASLARTKAERWNHQFLLVENNHSIAYTFYAKTEDMRRKWIDAIYLALDNTQPAGHKHGKHEFIMHTFPEPKECDICKKLLRGVFFQGYRCQATGMSVHKECIAKANGAPALPPRPDFPAASIGGGHLPTTAMLQSNKSIKCKAKAMMRYVGNPMPGNNRHPLMFEVDSVIDVLSTDDEHWWEGRYSGREGFFPASHVRRRLQHRESYEKTYPSLQQPVPPPSSNGHRSPNNYVNLDLSQYQWFVGEMRREVANSKLENHPNGTFLIRLSVNASRCGEYALSVKFENVKHIKVQSGHDNSYFLADCKLFRSIPELVEYYQNNTLKYSFPELDTTLGTPYKRSLELLSQDGAISQRNPHETVVYNRGTYPVIGYAIASFDYAAMTTNQISLRKGDRVKIISKAGGDKGWWKGELNGRIGYFPCAYVVEEEG